MRTLFQRALTALAIMMIAACDKPPEMDVTQVNALVPVKYRYKLHFEARKLTGGIHRKVSYWLPVPDGWRSRNPEIVKPLDQTANGDSAMWVHSSCGYDRTPCVKADWNADIDQNIQLLSVLKDERSPFRRVIRARPLVAIDAVSVQVYWWTPEGDEYYACEARLGVGLQEATDAFEKACELAIVEP